MQQEKANASPRDRNTAGLEQGERMGWIGQNGFELPVSHPMVHGERAVTGPDTL